MKEFFCHHRLIVSQSTVDSLRRELEPTEWRVWMPGGDRCRIHTIRGVPAKRIDVAVAETFPEDWAICMEIGRKIGGFDGAERWRITARRWSKSTTTWDDGAVKHRPIPHGTFDVFRRSTPDGERVILLAQMGATAGYSTEKGDSWSQSFAALRSDLIGYDFERLVMWHWTRYYRFVPRDDAESVGKSFGAAHPELVSLTLAEANRLASRDLYALARNLGWRKLTLRERKRFGFDAQWIRVEDVNKRRIEMGYSPLGVGKYTLDAGNGRKPMTEEEGDGIIKTAFGSVVVE